MTHAMTSMPKYESYKDSGFEWLKEVPAHWDLLRLGSRFEERRTKVSDKDFAPLSVTKMGVVPQLESAAKTNDGDNRKLVKKGDFVINSRSDRKGSSGIAFQDGSVSLINTVLHPKEIHPTYCNYLLKSNGFVEEFYRMGHGIVPDLWTTRYDEMSSIILGIPTLEEQDAIAKFLDEKTAQIDQAIGIKERQLALLKVRKQIIIQNAVTKGLNPNASMKDSGIDWIGDIPKNWDVKRLKYILSLKSIKISSKESKLRYLGMESIEAQTGILLDSNVEAEGLANYFEEGDILFGKLRPYLKKVYLAKMEGICSTEFLIYSAKNYDTSFYANFLISDQFISVVNSSTYGSKMPRANSDYISGLKIVVPPNEEKIEISDYIERKSTEIKLAIDLLIQQINNLKEYKASLINSAVTGKIKVI